MLETRPSASKKPSSWEQLTVSPDKTHHVFRDGTPAYEVRYVTVLPFRFGLAPAHDGRGATAIGPDGHPSFERTFLDMLGYYEGLCAVRDYTGWFHIDLKGKDA